MKLKEVEISFKFIIMCLFIALICISFGIIYDKLLFSMILFSTSLSIFILIELIGALTKDLDKSSENLRNKIRSLKDENRNTRI
ncbi:MAG TPA: hypothetical protein ENH46_05690 [Candidatus Pacearchaeota archaeon]|nr:hypothetical protein [Candidatus Pacearchaeota archaeon]